jgi:SOS regulatory protein LexA
LEKAKKIPGHKYAHIIVDESQDLTRSQLLFLKQLYNDKDGSSIIFIADTAQSIYPQSWLGSGRSFASIGFNMIGRGHLLSKNFRTTTQISQAAYSLIENCTEIVDDENFVKPYLIDKQGPYPVCKTFSNDATQAEYVAEEVSKYLLSNQPKDIAIVARFKNQLVYIQKYFGKKGIKSSFISKKEADFESASINLLTMHSIKGLEFRVVILIGLNDGVMPYYSSRDPGTRAEESIKERRLLYVGMTRATESLFLLSSGSKPSKFLMDIDSQFIKIDQQSQMRRFYNISIEDYRFKNKIQDIHANEEKIRQWVIAELIDSYKYPQDTISIEFPVNSFSRKGFVDIAIEINKEGQRTPFIFIETKRKGQGIESALNQLKSYMSNCKQCQYGVVTDGNDIKMIDNEFKPIADIPRFRHSWHSSSMRRYAYIDLKTKINYSLAIDDNDPTILEVYSDDFSDAIEAKHFNRLPVYGKIAAGTPLHMNVELDDRYYFPKEWHKGSKFFILKVQGDSMKNAGIDDDDYVVVRQQNNADNLDIVVVALSECATLKRFSKMGDNALLLSDNPKYDPILLNEDQVSILGVAVGLVKQKI